MSAIGASPRYACNLPFGVTAMNMKRALVLMQRPADLPQDPPLGHRKTPNSPQPGRNLNSEKLSCMVVAEKQNLC